MEPKPSPRRYYGLERELEIYQLGLQGKPTAIPIPVALLEQRAKEILTPRAYDYIAGSAGGEQTMRANLEAFYRWRIVPRMLRDVSQRDLSIQLFGATLPAPVLLGPVGVQGIIHKDGEIATARAAASLGLPFVLSTVSSRSIEEVAQALDSGIGWFQLYWSKQTELNASFVQRAERAGYKAIVVTLDTAMLGWRERDLHHRYLPFLTGDGLVNYFTDPVFCAALQRPPDEDPASAIRLWGSVISHPSLTWPDLKFLRQHTRLPILVKGILHPEDR